MVSLREKEVSLCLTVDICNAIFPEHKDVHRWERIIASAIALEERLSEIRDSFGDHPRITWFVRADPMMRHGFDSATFLFEKYASHLGRLSAKGHEIAWHPHLDYKNLKNDIRELPSIASQARKYFPMTSVRIGEGYHSSELMKIMNDLNFMADSTSLPGRLNLECKTPYDWSVSSANPYYPDSGDYRSSGKGRNLNILEIPFTMLPIKLSGDRPGPASRYMNFSYRREHFFSGVMARRNWSDVLVGITHPAELVVPDGYSKAHNLLSFDENVPAKNVKFLLDRLGSIGIKTRFKSIRDVERIIRRKESVMAMADEKLKTITFHERV